MRRATARALSDSDPRIVAAALPSLLADPVRVVRIEAAEVLAGVPAEVLASDAATALRRATDEYISAQELNADRPEAHLNLGLLYTRERKFDRAEAELKKALSLDPSFAPAAVNLADLHRELGRETDCEAVLRAGLQRSPNEASLLHALGLLMVRQKHRGQALDLLAAAARIDPGNARYAYVYAVALNDYGQRGAAIETLERSINGHPYDHDSLAALAGWFEQAGDPAKARTYAQRLDALEPANPQVHQMLEMLNDQLHGS